MFQTVKCLLIVPNAESALNEEAGKLLLDRYDDYSERAKMMTEIHAQVRNESFFLFSNQKIVDPYIKIFSNEKCALKFQFNRKGNSKLGFENGSTLSEVGGPLPKKHAGDKKLTAEKKKMLRDKKRTLKRL